MLVDSACVAREDPTVDDPGSGPPCVRSPRRPSTMRRVMEVVSTAVMDVTIVLMVSSGPVGLTMNQKKTFTRWTIAIVCDESNSAGAQAHVT
jgi:hypothetical protein